MSQGRVVVCCAHFHPHVGGVERFTENLWSRMVRRGWEVTILTSNTNAAACEDSHQGMVVWRLPVFSLLHRRAPLLRPSRFLKRIRRRIESCPPDAFVTNTRFFPTSLLGARLARRTRRPLIHIEHGSAPPRVNRKGLDLLIAWYDRLMGRMVLGAADRRLGVSRAVCEFVARMGYPDAGLLHNAVEADLDQRPAVDFRARLGIGPEQRLVVYVGRLVREKGVLDLLEAWQSCEHCEGMHLALAGAGDLEKRLSAVAPNTARMHVLGQLAPAAVRDLLLSAEMFAFPSTCAEGLPTVVLEAAAARLAIVATPAGGTTEIVTHERTGLIVEPHNPAALSQALDRFARDAQLRQACGTAAFARVREQFSWEVVTGRMEQILWETIKGRSRSRPLETSAGV